MIVNPGHTDGLCLKSLFADQLLRTHFSMETMFYLSVVFSG